MAEMLQSRQFWTLLIASAVGGLVVVWLAPMAKRLPPRD